MEEQPVPNQHDDSVDWKQLFARKDRPLPKAGCSWAFYLFLLALIAVFVYFYLQYKHQ